MDLFGVGRHQPRRLASPNPIQVPMHGGEDALNPRERNPGIAKGSGRHQEQQVVRGVEPTGTRTGCRLHGRADQP
jgi:hypothetical protein